MKYWLTVALLVNAIAHANPAIDMDGYLRISREAAEHRETRRVSEAEFIRMSREPGSLILDARSREKFDELHVAGAINLPFPDIAIESLKATIPDKNARASLNRSTYIALYSYGYRNIYELGPLIDIDKSRLQFSRP